MPTNVSQNNFGSVFSSVFHPILRLPIRIKEFFTHRTISPYRNLLLNCLEYTQRYYNNRPYVVVVSKNRELYIGKLESEQTDHQRYSIGNAVSRVVLKDVMKYDRMNEIEPVEQTVFDNPIAVLNPVFQELDVKHIVVVEDVGTRVELDRQPAKQLQTRMQTNTYPYVVEYRFTLGDVVYDSDAHTKTPIEDATVELTKDQFTRGYIGDDRYLPQIQLTETVDPQSAYVYDFFEKLPATIREFTSFENFSSYIEDNYGNPAKTLKIGAQTRISETVEKLLDVYRTQTTKNTQIGIFVIPNPAESGINDYYSSYKDGKSCVIIAGEYVNPYEVRNPVLLCDKFVVPLSNAVHKPFDSQSFNQIEFNTETGEFNDLDTLVTRWMVTELVTNYYNPFTNKLTPPAVICTYTCTAGRQETLYDVVLENTCIGSYRYDGDRPQTKTKKSQAVLGGRCEYKTRNQHNQLRVSDRAGVWLIDESLCESTADGYDIVHNEQVRTYYPATVSMRENSRGSGLFGGIELTVSATDEVITFEADNYYKNTNSRFCRHILNGRVLPPSQQT
jgi:hypothetical protein